MNCPNCGTTIRSSLVTDKNGRQRCGCQCHPDFSSLQWDARNPDFSVSDIDALFVSERFGHFLFIEWKHPGETAPKGQRRMLEGLAALPRTKVILVYGARGDPAQLTQVKPRMDWRAPHVIEQTDKRSFEHRLKQ